MVDSGTSACDAMVSSIVLTRAAGDKLSFLPTVLGVTLAGPGQNDVSNTLIDLEMASSFRQHSINSSSVTTPSWLRSIFYNGKTQKYCLELKFLIDFRSMFSIIST